MNLDLFKITVKIRLFSLLIKVLTPIVNLSECVSTRLTDFLNYLCSKVDIGLDLSGKEANLFYRLKNRYDYTDKESLDIIKVYRKTGELPEETIRKIARETIYG